MSVVRNLRNARGEGDLLADAILSNPAVDAFITSVLRGHPAVRAHVDALKREIAEAFNNFGRQIDAEFAPRGVDWAAAVANLPSLDAVK